MFSSKKVYLKFYIKICLAVLSYLLCSTGHAQLNPADQNTSFGLGQGFKNLSGFLLNLTDLVLAVTTIGGVAFFFAGIAKFYQHRQHPMQVPLSQCVVMFFLSAVLIALPYLLIYGESAYYLIKNL